VKRVASRDNAHFRRLWRLANVGKERRGSGQMLLDGAHLIEAYTAVFGPADLQLVVRSSVAETATAGYPAGLDPIILADALFDEIAPVETPTGLLGVAPIPISPVATAEAERPGFNVFLDGIQDPGNLGAVLRSAAAAGASEAFLSAQCADPWSPKCLRGGMGAHFHLRLHDRVDLPEAARGFPGRLLAADSHGGRCLFEADVGGDIGFILGGEGQGISAPMLAMAAERVHIPMADGVESLNIAAAATLLFYEWRRHRAPDFSDPSKLPLIT
jgi:TrmH family RNA methyltransferase